MKYVHPKERLFERYGLTISNVGIKELEMRIEFGDCVLLRIKPNETQQYLIEYKNKIVRLVYDPKSKMIVTFLSHNEKYDLMYNKLKNT